MQYTFKSSSKHNHSAFTLIELLVVIAIIAILAAILFPVFAQAKVAAKGAASLSNTKQTTLATIMYSADSDDLQVLHAAMNDTTAPADNTRPWSVLLLPYMKSSNLFLDPLTTAWKAYPTGNDELNNTYATQYAYIYQIHAPVIYDGTNWLSTPSSATALAAPANTVFMVSSRRVGDGGPWWWYGDKIGLDEAYNVGVPFCDTTGYTLNPQAICGPGYKSWGIGSIDTYTGDTNPAHGALTAGVSARKAGQVAVSFADGHAAMMAPGRLAAGTNWNESMNSTSVTVTDQTKYMWDNL